MSEETRMILERLDVMSQDIKETKCIALEARDAANEAKLEAREAKKIAIEARDAANRANYTANEALRVALSTKQAVEEVDKKVVYLQTTMENELRKQITIIGEAHDFLKMKLDQALAMEIEREKMWLEILNLRIDMRNVKEKLCIA